MAHPKFKEAWSVFKETFSKWSDDRAATMAASLAYFTFFSIAPVLIIVVAVAGFVFGQEAAQGEIYRQLEGLLGDAGATAVQGLVASANQHQGGILATVIGTVALLFGATGVFSQLQESLNVIWKAPPTKTNGIVAFFRVRFLSFAVVLGIGFLLLVSLVVSAGISATGRIMEDVIGPWGIVAQGINLIISLGLITVLFAMMYKLLPDLRVAWRDVWVAAGITAALFTIGKYAIGLYLGTSAVTSSYGAAGSLAVLLLWTFYSSMILLWGAEFSYLIAKRRDPSQFADASAAPSALNANHVAQAQAPAPGTHQLPQPQ